MFREGKSTILNRMLLRIKRGFNVTHETEACTKGIWIWNQVIPYQQNGQLINILVADTEGLGADDADDRHDLHIFCLSLLTSSHFIYNSMRTINRDAINKLKMVVEISKGLQDGFKPQFTWLVRDAALLLVNNG